MSAATTKELKGLFSQIHDAAKRAAARVNELNEQINALLSQRHDLERLILSKADYMVLVREKIRNAGTIHADMLGHKQVGKLDRTIMAVNRFSLGIDFMTAGMDGVNPVNYNGLCYFFEDQIVNGLDKALDALEWPAEGDTLPLATIKAKIEEIDAQVNDMVTERDSFNEVLKSFEVVS